MFDQYLRVTREALPKGFVVEEFDSKFIIHNEWAYHYLRPFHAFNLEVSNPKVLQALEAAWGREGGKGKSDLSGIGMLSYYNPICKRSVCASRKLTRLCTP